MTSSITFSIDRTADIIDDNCRTTFPQLKRVLYGVTDYITEL